VKEATAYRLMLLPALVGVVLLELVPAALTTALAFAEFDALSAARWVGLHNFAALAANPSFAQALRASGFFLLLSLPIRFGTSLLAALLLGKPSRGFATLRSAHLAPTLIPEAAYAFAFLYIFNPVYGPVNQMLANLRLPAPGWLADADYAPWVFVIMAVFQAGESFLIVRAGLASVPRELLEAAEIDGAGGWARFRRVLLPLLVPWLGAAMLRDCVLLMFYPLAPVRLISGAGPDNSTLFMPFFSWQQLDFLNLGVASAGTVVLWLLALAPFALSLRWLHSQRDV
jgi:multiple sugar transport system permease protein